MSSTDDERLRRFWSERLAPVARRLRDRGIEFFPLGPDDDKTTYYAPPPTVPDFTTLDEDECAPSLREMWRSEGLVELADLVEELMALARELEVAEEDTADISPFVYVMY